MKRRIRSEISEVRISEVTFGVKQYLLYALQGLNESSLKKMLGDTERQHRRRLHIGKCFRIDHFVSIPKHW